MPELETQHVPSGSYHIGKRQPILLQAFLGSCVGVSICDPDTDVGGMIHLLLPDPITPGSNFQAVRYASTGLPLFLEALADAGATLKNMQAVIAGGALVGPISRQDLTLNIGGRTADVAKDILADRNIYVKQSETGGFFACTLQLNMENWKSSIEPVGFSRLSSDDKSPAVPNRNDIMRAAAQIQPIPQVALKILRILDEEDYSIERISKEVQKDQVICAKTLQLCNSALYAKKQKIESLSHALVYLGHELWVKLVISASVQSYFETYNHGYSLCKGGLYHHAVGTATITEKLARYTGKAHPPTAYTAGLLHDIGKVVLDQFVTSSFPLFYRDINNENQNLIEIETRILGVDHTRVGAELADLWSFPASLKEAIQFHHNPESSSRYPELAHLVFMADLLMSRFNTGLEIERLNTETIDKRMAYLGLEKSRFADIVDLIPKEVLRLTSATTETAG
jgi:putative nucleotidyltransferase with HDIG domain